MDISETYIKMCDCPEIQKEWEPINGDWCWHNNEGEEIYGSWEFPAQVSVVNINQETDREWWLHWLWLPRQDQLQEMVGKTKCNTIEGFNKFCGLINESIWFIKPEYFDYSMEQLWLAFVMKERYGKVWENHKWIQTNDVTAPTS